MALRLGIDTGGTYTDAVLIDHAGTVVASSKSLTTHHDLAIGVNGAVAALPAARRSEIQLVGLSTTLATNAIVEGRTGRAALIMIGFSAKAIERAGLKHALKEDPYWMIEGGHGPAGDEMHALDEAALKDRLEAVPADVSGLAVAAAFAVRNPAHERRAAKIAREVSGKPVTCSHELTSKLDGPRRALTTLFNARLIGKISVLLDAVETTLDRLDIKAPLMVVRGDGALFSKVSARTRPIETILSGPAASCVGAAWLTGLKDAYVSDIGGTTTDIGMIEDGRPKRSADGAIVGGQRTMVEAVDVTTIGLGGDSFVFANDGNVEIGPERALPIGRLAQDYPCVLDALNRQIERPEPRPYDGVFAILHALPDTLPALTRSQSKLLDLLKSGPQTLENIVERQRLGMSLDLLIARGWVLRAAFTPSDAARILGLIDLFDDGASRLAAVLLERVQQRRRGADPARAVAIAQEIVELFEQISAREISMFGLRASGLQERILADGEVRTLIGWAVRTNDDAPFSINPKLKRTLVGVGAPAALFYAATAARLEARLEMPRRFDVCNAVGAVVGLVNAKAEIMISVEDNRITVLLDDGPALVADIDQATALARDHASQAARKKIEDEGAGDVSVRLSETVTDYKDVAGNLKVIEVHVLAEAVGRPPFSNILGA